MRRCFLFALAFLFALPAAAGRLDPGSIQYMGYFQAPPPQGSGNAQTWSFGTSGMTLIPDCMGRPDPTPGDGYPGCIGAFGNKAGMMFGVFDIVPPGGKAQQVVPFYSLGEGLPTQVLGNVGSERYWDVLYDRGPSHCRIWWTYGTWYVRISEDSPFLGMSSCNPGNPNPQGMWDFGPEWSGNIQADPFATAKMYQALSLIPQSLADRYFGGNQMMLGLSRKSGTRGGSQGPSLYARPLAEPGRSAPGPLLDATPMLWYKYTNYVKWWDEPEMNGGAARHWTESKAYGAEFVTSSQGDAVVLPWEEPTINPLDYPCSDPGAYRDNDPTTPEPCEVPVCWYGQEVCFAGQSENQKPSFWEDTSTGVPMPADCNIQDTCFPSAGPHCLSERPFLILYDVNELSQVYAGARAHNSPQPYAKIPLSDYWLDATECGSESNGSTYDPQRQILYVSQGRGTPVVHMFAIGGTAPPPPPPPPPPSGPVLKAPKPGLAGVLNDFRIEGADPNGVMFLVGSKRAGSTPADEVCPGTTFNIGAAHFLGHKKTKSNGIVEVTVAIPPQLSKKKIYLQAIDSQTCKLTNVVQFTFP